jgi:hypothetical protein
MLSQNQQASFPVAGSMNNSQTPWQSQHMTQSFPSTTYRALITPMPPRNQLVQASNGQGRVVSTIAGRPSPEVKNDVAFFPFVPLSSSITSLQNMYNHQHQVMSTSNEDMQGQVAAANLAPNSQQDLPTSSNLLATGFQSRESLLQPAISMVGQNYQEICEIAGFSLSGGSQGLERPQSPEGRLQAASNQALRVQSYAHDVSIHPEEARSMMLSHQVPFGASRQSWDFIDDEEHIGEDEYHNTPTIEEDFEPNAIFPPE